MKETQVDFSKFLQYVVCTVLSRNSSGVGGPYVSAVSFGIASSVLKNPINLHFQYR